MRSSRRLLSYTLLTALLTTGALGCDSKKEKKRAATSPRTTSAPSTTPRSTAPPRGLEPPAPRIASPLAIRDIDASTPPIGELVMRSTTGEEKRSPLLGVSVARCREGWIFQGFHMGSKERLVTTAPLVMLEDTPRVGEEVTYINPNNKELSTRYRLDRWDGERVEGSIALSRQDERPRIEVTFKGINRPPAPARGLATLGCFTTGSYKLEREGSTREEGPITAVSKSQGLYRVHMELTPSHALSIWLRIAPTDFRDGEVLAVELSDVLADPKAHDTRAFFETRATKNGLLHWEQRPIKAGRLSVSLEGADPRDAIAHISLDGVTFPEDWDGPLPGERHDIRAATRFVTDRDGLLAPLPPR